MPVQMMKNPLRSLRLQLLAGLAISLMMLPLTAGGQAKPGHKNKPAAPATPAAAVKPAAPADAPRYKNASLPIEDRVADLMSRMTLEEKVEQLASGWENQIEVIDPTGTYTTETARQTILSTWGPELKFTARQAAILRNGVQRYQREKTRLGIPALFMGEALHGLMEYGSTSFPSTLALASTWDPALVKRVFTAAGDEAGSRGVGQVFSPVLGIARDPRWGRTEETYGEDPYLVSRMGVAAIEGLQGDSFLIDRHHVMATAKHFAVHGQPEGGTNTAPGNISERDNPRELSCALQGRGPGGPSGQRDGLLQRDRRRSLAHQPLAAGPGSAPGVGIQGLHHLRRRSESR